MFRGGKPHAQPLSLPLGSGQISNFGATDSVI